MNLQNKYLVFTDWLGQNFSGFQREINLVAEFEVLYEEAKWKQLMFNGANGEHGPIVVKDTLLVTGMGVLEAS